MSILSLEQLLQLHALAIEATGGSSGLRDLGRLEAAIAVQTQSVFGGELYPTVIEKAAAVIRGIIADHPFVDGNKRTAMLAGLTLLRINSLDFTASPGEIEDFAVNIAVARLDVPAVASWLTFAETFRTIYMDISPLRFKEIRELVDDYEAGRLDLTEVKEQ